MQIKGLGELHRTTIVCIDSYENGVPVGRFYNPYYKGCQSFRSLSQLLVKMEQALDAMSFPASFTAARSFAAAPGSLGEAAESSTVTQGGAATFAVRILFRQNTSWQGSVCWMEKNREESFRSVLELVLLMDSALQDKAA